MTTAVCLAAFVLVLYVLYGKVRWVDHSTVYRYGSSRRDQ